MTAHSDDPKVIELLAPLSRIEPVPFRGTARDRQRTPRRPVLVVAAVILALALTGVAIADGLGAFDGIGAAQHPQTGADVIDPATLAYMEGRDCPGVCMPSLRPVLDTFRVVGWLPSGQNIYVFSTRARDLCYVVGPPHPEWDCEDPLTAAHPSTVFVYAADPGALTTLGIALDGVTAVSFRAGGHDVTVPVKDNVWVYPGAHPDAMGSLTVHFTDGKTVVQTYP